jgi:hypothetical protein
MVADARVPRIRRASNVQQVGRVVDGVYDISCIGQQPGVATLAAGYIQYPGTDRDAEHLHEASDLMASPRVIE